MGPYIQFRHLLPVSPSTTTSQPLSCCSRSRPHFSNLSRPTVGSTDMRESNNTRSVRYSGDGSRCISTSHTNEKKSVKIPVLFCINGCKYAVSMSAGMFERSLSKNQVSAGDISNKADWCTGHQIFLWYRIGSVYVVATSPCKHLEPRSTDCRRTFRQLKTATQPSVQEMGCNIVQNYKSRD